MGVANAGRTTCLAGIAAAGRPATTKGLGSCRPFGAGLTVPDDVAAAISARDTDCTYAASSCVCTATSRFGASRRRPCFPTGRASTSPAAIPSRKTVGPAVVPADPTSGCRPCGDATAYAKATTNTRPALKAATLSRRRSLPAASGRSATSSSGSSAKPSRIERSGADRSANNRARASPTRGRYASSAAYEATHRTSASFSYRALRSTAAYNADGVRDCTTASPLA